MFGERVHDEIVKLTYISYCAFMIATSTGAKDTYQLEKEAWVDMTTADIIINFSFNQLNADDPNHGRRQ